jgi:NitT/TauT family transport system substrate-binding protein
MRRERVHMLVLAENFRALFYAPFYAAFALGSFEAEGVAVRLRPSSDPASTAEDLMADKIDAMWGGPQRVMLTHWADAGARSTCFCNVVARDPFFIVGREPRPDFRLADLVGPRFASVAEVPTPWLCLQDDLRRGGVNPAALTRTSGPSMAENAESLRAGTLDAVQLFQPYVETLVAEGVGHIWYAAATRGLTAYTTLVARRSVLAARRDEFAAMVRGMYRVLRWIAETPGTDVAAALAEFFPDVPQPIFAAAIDRYRALELYAPDPVLRREGVDRLQAAMLSRGALQRLLPFEAVVDNSLAAAAL